MAACIDRTGIILAKVNIALPMPIIPVWYISRTIKHLCDNFDLQVYLKKKKPNIKCVCTVYK